MYHAEPHPVQLLVIQGHKRFSCVVTREAFDPPNTNQNCQLFEPSFTCSPPQDIDLENVGLVIPQQHT
jgi:hypothetical protein